MNVVVFIAHDTPMQHVDEIAKVCNVMEVVYDTTVRPPIIRRFPLSQRIKLRLVEIPNLIRPNCVKVNCFREEWYERHLKSLNPDLIISFLPPADDWYVLREFNEIKAYQGLLSEFWAEMPIFWSLVHGKAGVTIFKPSLHVEDSMVYRMIEVEIGNCKTVYQLKKKVNAEMISLLVDVIKNYDTIETQRINISDFKTPPIDDMGIRLI